MKAKPKTASVKIPEGSKITILTKANPRLKGTLAHRMIELYKNGITVESFVAAGGRLSDIRWDVLRNHIKLSATEPAAKKKGGK